MKTILTILLTAICLHVTAETNFDIIKFERQLEILSEEAFKAGAVSGHAYMVLGIATNIDDVASVEAGHRIAEQAWGEFKEFQKGRHLEKSRSIISTNNMPSFGITAIRATNGYFLMASNSPNNVHLELSGVLETNWTTTSIESPVVAKGHEYDAIMRYDMLHQNGTVISNTVAAFKWKGKTISPVVESVELLHTNRTVGAMPSMINLQ